jgi:hypothetical protein
MQVILASCSPFIKSLLEASQNCECDALTIYLPDFDSVIVKNLLAILYTGKNNVCRKCVVFFERAGGSGLSLKSRQKSLCRCATAATARSVLRRLA